MRTTRWALKAQTDLIGIWRYIAAEDASAARRVIEDVHQVVDAIARTPEIGSPLANGDRKISVRRFPYLVRYRVRSGEIEIKRVHHMAQDWPYR